MTLNDNQMQARVDSAKDILRILTDLGEDPYSHYPVDDITWVCFDEQHARQTARE